MQVSHHEHMTDATLTLDNVTYLVLAAKEIPVFPGRAALTLKRPRGKRFYTVIRYETGAYSQVV
jgi:hypothetical protein